tara:strand:+ start:1585 stop:2571 length:987 start_codon:yes stop_codon:yes gene_type:complete
VLKKYYSPEKILICGFGSIGERYVKLLKENWPESKVGVLTSKEINKIPSLFKIEFISDNLSDCIRWKPNAVIICNPATFHVDYAIEFLSVNIPVLIEKPLCTEEEQDSKLNTLETLSKSCPVLLGYVLRYDKAYSFLKDSLDNGDLGEVLKAKFYCSSWLPDWRGNKDYRKSVSSQKILGGGALLELSHEIDLAQSLLGQIYLSSSILKNSGKLDIDVEDIVLLRGRSTKCKQIFIELDFCSKKSERVTYLEAQNGSIKWDIENRYIEKNIYGKDKERILLEKDTNHRFINQITHFFECINENITPLCGVKDGVIIIDIIKKARELSF